MPILFTVCFHLNHKSRYITTKIKARPDDTVQQFLEIVEKLVKRRKFLKNVSNIYKFKFRLTMPNSDKRINPEKKMGTVFFISNLLWMQKEVEAVKSTQILDLETENRLQRISELCKMITTSTTTTTTTQTTITTTRTINRPQFRAFRNGPRGRKAPKSPDGGGGDAAAEIKRLKREMAEAIENEEFEKCSVIKKKIKALESKKSTQSAPKFDQAGYDNALKSIKSKMGGYIANEDFEKCASLRDKKKKLEAVKKKWDSSGGNARLQTKLKQIISSI